MTLVKKVQQWATFARTWHIYDCTWQNPFDSAKVIRTHLTGRHKPIYHPMSLKQSLNTSSKTRHLNLQDTDQFRKPMGRLGELDPSSFAEPDKVNTVSSSLNWIVDFENTKIKGSVTHRFNVLVNDLSSILLDVRDITIKDVVGYASESKFSINYFVSDAVKDLGSKLTLELPQGIAKGEFTVCIDYETSSKASGLQWLTPEQTLGKKKPYMFSQCQAIHARSVMPCQDTPAVKFTYDATVKHPKDLKALMSALIENNTDGVTSFKQTVPIPSYLLAIAVGDVVSRPLGPISNVWAEEAIVDECAEEFSQTNDFLKTASEICGPYVWKRYDLLVMPPSFPFGGMENPCLTFVTPTLLAGDKSLADVVAHEIAHSWTGNLVTNRNFEHFWLNEGFTVFVEAKIVGRMKGNSERDFHMLRNLTDLAETLRTQLADTPELSKLVPDLNNCSPDDAFSSVPYIKGSTFLRYIEDHLGGANVFEPFLQHYLNKYAYKSVVTTDFREALYDFFKNTNKIEKLDDIDWELWLHQEGMPPIIPKFDESLAITSKELAAVWSTTTNFELKADTQIRKTLSSLQIIDFLGKLVESPSIVDLDASKIALLESVYSIKNTRNSEIRFRLMRLCIRARLIERMNEILDFVNSNFRMKFCRPIYRDLGKWPEARPIAVDNFNKVKPQMMAVCVQCIGKDLELNY